MKKIDWNHPITRKDYVVLCGVGVGICIVYGTIYIIFAYWRNIKNWVGDKIKKLKQLKKK